MLVIPSSILYLTVSRQVIGCLFDRKGYLAQFNNVVRNMGSDSKSDPKPDTTTMGTMSKKELSRSASAVEAQQAHE